MTDEDRLFDLDLIPDEPQIIRGRSQRGIQVEEAWELWADLTKRPDADTIPEQFRKEYLNLLNHNYDHEDLCTVIDGAARLEPRPRDPKDIRRVIKPLTNWNHDALARAAIEDDAPYIPFPQPSQHRAASIVDLEDATGTQLDQWTDNEFEAAGILIQQYERATLLEMAKAARLSVDAPYVFPSEILRYGTNTATAKASTHRSSYASGSAEHMATSPIAFDVDVQAKRMLLAGEPIADIRAFHELAPEGYWEAVATELADDPMTDLDLIYEKLSEEYHWHPEDR